MTSAALAWATIGGIAVAVLNDAAGAFAARRLGFPLARLALPTIVVYVLLGFFVKTALGDLRSTLIVVAVAALASATGGYALVRRIDPPRLEATRLRLLLSLGFSAILEIAAAFCGATWIVYGVAWALLHR